MIRTRIYPNELFDLEALKKMLGPKCKQSSLRREIRLGRLKVCKRLNYHWFLGEDILAWIKSGALARMESEEALETAGAE